MIEGSGCKGRRQSVQGMCLQAGLGNKRARQKNRCTTSPCRGVLHMPLCATTQPTITSQHHTHRNTPQSKTREIQITITSYWCYLPLCVAKKELLRGGNISRQEQFSIVYAGNGICNRPFSNRLMEICCLGTTWRVL